jgi:uncharacterized protein YdaU (DUF1376 family)
VGGGYIVLLNSTLVGFFIMEKEKDPAFLMYSKDWIDGTAELSPCAKGVFIDLLCYQHQRGTLPNDMMVLSRLARISEEEMIIIWGEIRCKFVLANGRIYNKKLTKVMAERAENSRINKINGTFAYVLKSFNLKPKDREALKQRYKEARLTEGSTEWSTERLREWCLSGIPFIEDEDEDANENANSK